MADETLEEGKEGIRGETRFLTASERSPAGIKKTGKIGRGFSIRRLL